MDAFDLAFKSLTVVNTVLGYLLLAIASHEDIQKELFYDGHNPLVGDILKYLVLSSCWSLVLATFFLMYSLKISLIFSWASVVFFASTALLGMLESGRLPNIGKPGLISLGIRIFGASTLTYLYLHIVRS